jgi:hypothetical protein
MALPDTALPDMALPDTALHGRLVARLAVRGAARHGAPQLPKPLRLLPPTREAECEPEAEPGRAGTRPAAAEPAREGTRETADEGRRPLLDVWLREPSRPLSK